MKRDSKLMLPMIFGPWTAFMLSYALAFIARSAPNTKPFIGYILLCSAIGITFSWLAWRFVLSATVRRVKVIGVAGVLSLLLTAAVIDVVHAVIVTLSQPYFFGSGPGNFFSGVLMEFISFYFVYCMIFFFALTLELSHRDAERRERLSQAESRAHQAQAMALRLQINPHFLFNALNAVASLISARRDPEALATLHRLSGFLRIVTETSPHEFSPLSDELEMAEEYLSVEAIRFQDRLSIEIEAAPETAGVLTPNFILQPLIENAIKHGVGATEQPTAVSIRARMIDGLAEITVGNRSCDPAVRDYRPDGMGVGLRNVADRLKAIYGGAATMDSGHVDGGFQVVLRLPPSGARAGDDPAPRALAAADA
ncbi:MAG: histidine kinase [Caulobacter sp.]|nr:histidine kinase [Caulobacter sp.]